MTNQLFLLLKKIKKSRKTKTECSEDDSSNTTFEQPPKKSKKMDTAVSSQKKNSKKTTFSSLLEKAEKEAIPNRQFCYDRSILKADSESQQAKYDISIETPNAKKYIVIEQFDIDKISKVSPSLRWKHVQYSAKLCLTDTLKKDAKIQQLIKQLFDEVAARFMSDETRIVKTYSDK
ncbi:uncharacterized protein LOC126844027 [Adelges cooleyi]|uniref:uncharacterized protein LOC126844027 n=1 Tax=Adelges cooleyi TaxID=133065 RepID=UPI00217F6E7E|nr:uncharacterized protein LOC126844027 [Adelges cooleyi]